MITAQHKGHEFRAEGNTVFVGKEYFAFIGDVLKLESQGDTLLVVTDYDRYSIVGQPDRPETLCAQSLPS